MTDETIQVNKRLYEQAMQKLKDLRDERDALRTVVADLRRLLCLSQQREADLVMRIRDALDRAENRDLIDFDEEERGHVLPVDAAYNKPVEKVIPVLEDIGYSFRVDRDFGLIFDVPKGLYVERQPLVDFLKANEEKIIAYLQRRSKEEIQRCREIIDGRRKES